MPVPEQGLEWAHGANLIQTENKVACGSPHCPGCYEVQPGVRIHPPKSGEGWEVWLLKWEPKGRMQ
jgi:hypothetical protein